MLFLFSKSCNGLEVSAKLGLNFHNWVQYKYFFIAHYHKNKPSELPQYKYGFHHANWEDMNQYSYSNNFSQIFNSRDIKFIWEQLKVAIHNATNMFVPKVSTRIANQPRWFTPFISNTKSSACIPWEEGMRNNRAE